MTGNTEAVEKLVKIFWDSDTLDTKEDIAKAILVAIQADPLAYVKPKPLGWEGPFSQSEVDWSFSGGCEYRAKTEKFKYYIWSRTDGTFYVPQLSMTITYPTLEAAQAAAYDDLCNRVKELF